MEPQRTLTNRERAIEHARKQLDDAREAAAAAEQSGDRENKTVEESPGKTLANAPQSSSSAPVEIAAAFAGVHDRLDAIVRRLEASELERSKRASSTALDAVGALTDEELRPIANECEVTIGQVRSIGEWLARLVSGASSAP